MPRGFREDERERIRKGLLQVGQEHFERYGLRRTNVEDLARQTGIAKGSFYRFFESKEMLFLAIVGKLEVAIRAEMTVELEKLRPSPRAMVRRFLEYPFVTVAQHPILRVLADPEEAALLMRKVPAEALAANRADDERFFFQFIERWQKESILVECDPSTVVGFLHAAFTLSMQQAIIGKEKFQAVVDFMLDGMTAHLVRGKP